MTRKANQPRFNQSPVIAMLEHRFNHDLLISQEDREAALARWPALGASLYDDRAVQAFISYEREALQNKQRVRAAGTLSVGLALVALLGALADLLGSSWAHDIAVPLGVAAFTSFVLAFLASRFYKWRRRWLLSRFATERIRQWHFGMLLAGGAATEAAHASADRTPGADRREHLLSELLADLSNSVDARMVAFQQGAANDDFLLPSVRHPQDHSIREQILGAYYALRLKHQLDYATHKISLHDKSYWGLSGAVVMSVTDKLAAATLVGAILLAMLTIFDLSIEGSLVAGSTLLAALVGVAVRAWRDGLAVGADYERYHDYRSKLTYLKARWDLATSDAERFEITYDVEVAAADELKSFLRVHEAAQFIF